MITTLIVNLEVNEAIQMQKMIRKVMILHSNLQWEFRGVKTRVSLPNSTNPLSEEGFQSILEQSHIEI